MSLRFASASSQYAELNVAAAAFPWNSAYTMMAKVWAVSLPSAYMALFGFWKVAGGINQDTVDIVEIDPTHHLELNTLLNGGGQAPAGSTTLSSATWYDVVLRRTAVNAMTVSVGTTVHATSTTDMTTRAANPDRIELGNWNQSNDSGRTDYGDIRICRLLIYTVALSDAEVTSQLNFWAPQRTANLWGRWDLSSTLTETSANGRGTFTFGGGTAAYEADPTLSDSPAGGGSTNYTSNPTGLSATESLGTPSLVVSGWGRITTVSTVTAI